MRFTLFVAILPALAVAQEQAPLGDRVQGWFNKAKAYLPSATPVVPVEKVVEQKIQEKTVTPFNLTNWQSNLEPAAKPQDWLVFVTGGNKTCFGRCDQANKAFNVSTPYSPGRYNLGEKKGVSLMFCRRNPFSCFLPTRPPPTWEPWTVSRTRFCAPPGLPVSPAFGISRSPRRRMALNVPRRLSI